ncbi:MAG: sigma-70 family RNA polymerase sigma factor, partial [Chryseobacterium sp.]
MDGKDIRFQKIITGIKARDLVVQEQIYKSYWGYLMAVCLRYVNDRDTAMEVVNDSFIKVFKIVFDFNFDEDGETAHKMFKSWMTKIAVRTALDRLRSKRSYLSYTDDYQEIPEEYVAVESKLHAAEIMNLLQEIPDMHRTVFNLYE